MREKKERVDKGKKQRGKKEFFFVRLRFVSVRMCGGERVVGGDRRCC